MEQVMALWTGWDWPRRAAAIGSSVAVLGLLLLLGRGSVTPDYALLYAGLDPAAAGEVVAELDAQGVPYRIAGGGIEVPAADRDRLRMVLAGNGLPRTGGAGYEILDSLSGFGTTSQMFDAALQRAKEGELARTMLAHPGIRAARVHISGEARSPFDRGTRLAASVVVTPNAPGAIGADQARALRYLVSSAVSGLGPEDVAVIDGSSGRVIDGDDPLGGGGLSSRRAAELRKNVLRLLEPHVGIGGALVEVHVDLVTEQESYVERRIDPDSRVQIATEKAETNRSSTGSGTGPVTVASNLPDGDTAGTGGTEQSSDRESREQAQYDFSEVTREVVRQPGDIRRISVAVLVDGHTEVGTDGTPVWTARTAEELEALESLVASAVGLDPARGDSLTLRSMRLVGPSEPDATPSPPLVSFGELDTMRLIQLGVLTVVLLGLAAFVVRPLLRARALPLPPARAAIASDGADPDMPVAATPPATASAGPGLTDMSQDAAEIPSMAIGTFAFPDDGPLADAGSGSTGPSARLDEAEAVARLRNLIADRREEALEVLRGWVEASETAQRGPQR